MKCPDTSSTVSHRPRRRSRWPSCCTNCRSRTDVLTGNAGTTRRCSSITAALNNASATNALRQPNASPISAPSGTPSTDAAATPPKMIEVARPMRCAGTRRAASPPAMAQMPPMQNPTSTRAANSQPMPGASADARLATSSSPSSAHRTRRRSMPPAAITTSGASRAGSEIIRPAVPVDAPRSSAIGVSRPTGSISVVTTEKVARPTAETAHHGWRGTSAACAGDEPLTG